MDDGDVTISCHWRGRHKNNPAYIHVSWKADITAPGELYVRFSDPDDQKIFSELPLGTTLAGEEIFSKKDLGFDPSARKWAISVMFVEAEK